MNPARAHRYLGDSTLAEKRFTSRWSVNSTFTGTGTLTIHTPVTGSTITVKGWQLVLVVTTTLAASEGISVYLGDHDGSTLAVGPGLCGFGKIAQQGEWRQAYQDAFQGFRLGGANNSLRLAASASIAGGVIRVTGVVYGTEEA